MLSLQPTNPLRIAQSQDLEEIEVIQSANGLEIGKARPSNVARTESTLFGSMKEHSPGTVKLP